MDRGPTADYSTSGCGCWEIDPIARGLSPSTHKLVVTNTTPEHVDSKTGPTGGFLVQAWEIDAGGSALQNLANFNSTDPRLTYSSVTFVQDANSSSGTLAMAKIEVEPSDFYGTGRGIEARFGLVLLPFRWKVPANSLPDAVETSAPPPASILRQQNGHLVNGTGRTHSLSHR